MASYLFNLLLIVGAAFVILFWWNTQGIKQRAYQVARRHCEEHGLQLLDQSVMLKRVRLQRNNAGGLSVLRVFRFEFASTGDERYYGEVSSLGRLPRGVKLDVHRI